MKTQTRFSYGRRGKLQFMWTQSFSSVRKGRPLRRGVTIPTLKVKFWHFRKARSSYSTHADGLFLDGARQRSTTVTSPMNFHFGSEYNHARKRKKDIGTPPTKWSVTCENTRCKEKSVATNFGRTTTLWEATKYESEPPRLSPSPSVH